MRRQLLSIALLCGLAGMAAAPLASAARLRVGLGVRFGPPARVVEVAPAARPGRVWSGGYWNWNGRRYVWRRGHWLAARPGYRYYPSRWVQEGPAWRFHVGYWGR